MSTIFIKDSIIDLSFKQTFQFGLKMANVKKPFLKVYKEALKSFFNFFILFMKQCVF